MFHRQWWHVTPPIHKRNVDGWLNHQTYLLKPCRLQVEHPVTEAITGVTLGGSGLIPNNLICLTSTWEHLLEDIFS